MILSIRVVSNLPIHQFLQLASFYTKYFLIEVESSEFCHTLIEKRAKDGAVGKAPFFDNVCSFNMVDIEEKNLHPDGLLGGFPCQVGASLFPSFNESSLPTLLPGGVEGRQNGWPG